MGATGSGKTSLVNMASGSGLRVGGRLTSCTDDVQLADRFTLDGREVILVDTPGFDDTSKSDTDVLKLIAAFLATAYEHGSKLAGIIYIHRISDYRFTGIAGRNFKMFRKLCGDSTLRNVVLVTNMWGQVPQGVAEEREEELTSNFFKPVLDKGAQLVRHHNTPRSAHDIIRRIMKNQPAVLQIQRELVDEGRDIVDTAAGEAINEELNQQIRRHQVELKTIKEEMEHAMKEKDEEMRRELEEETRKLQEHIDRTKADLETMSSRYDDEKQKMEDEMRRIQEEARQEMERVRAEHIQQMEDLNRQLEASGNASAAEREAMQERINQLQHQINNPPRRRRGFWDIVTMVAPLALFLL